jgi:hypothetical protein
MTSSALFPFMMSNTKMKPIANNPDVKKTKMVDKHVSTVFGVKIPYVYAKPPTQEEMSTFQGPNPCKEDPDVICPNIIIPPGSESYIGSSHRLPVGPYIAKRFNQWINKDVGNQEVWFDSVWKCNVSGTVRPDGKVLGLVTRHPIGCNEPICYQAYQTEGFLDGVTRNGHCYPAPIYGN